MSAIESSIMSSDNEIPGKKIFILEDEKDIAELVSINLQKAGFKCREFYRAEKFLSAIKEEVPDLLILDLMLPDMDFKPIHVRQH